MPEADQLTLDDLEQEAHARRGDPRTSHDAAKTVNLRKLQVNVLLLFRHEDGTRKPGAVVGFTDEEFVDLLLSMIGDTGPSPSGLRTARSELTKAGLVEPTGTTRPTKRGRQAEVYRLSDAGRAFDLGGSSG